jgi:predicted nucleic acid-binding protein
LRVWDDSGVAFSRCAGLRRGGVLLRRTVADCLIGAQAEHHGLDVLTFDVTVHRAVFLHLTLLVC